MIQLNLIDTPNHRFPHNSANLWRVFHRAPAAGAGSTGPTVQISTEDWGVAHAPVHWPHCHTGTSGRHATWRDATLTACCDSASPHTPPEGSLLGPPRRRCYERTLSLGIANGTHGKERALVEHWFESILDCSVASEWNLSIRLIVPT